MIDAKRQRGIRERVWYIEARACDSLDAFASEDAASMGSGVLVEIEQRGEPGAVRRYLLTTPRCTSSVIPAAPGW